MNYLEHLDLSYNHLRNLKKVLGGLEHLRFLKSLSLVGNPCCEEPGYRILVLTIISSLNVLDFQVVTDLERQVAVKQHRNSNKQKKGATSPITNSNNLSSSNTYGSGSVSGSKQTNKKISCLDRLQKEAAKIREKNEATAIATAEEEEEDSQSSNSTHRLDKLPLKSSAALPTSLDKTSTGRLKTDYFSVFSYADCSTQIKWS